jgi:hypothetical protein
MGRERAPVALVVCATVAAAAIAKQRHLPEHGQRYSPEYTASGELILPKNFHEWIYVGSPLTPNALNDGKAGFPEYHNVYMGLEFVVGGDRAAPRPAGESLHVRSASTYPRPGAMNSRNGPAKLSPRRFAALTKLAFETNHSELAKLIPC